MTRIYSPYNSQEFTEKLEELIVKNDSAFDISLSMYVVEYGVVMDCVTIVHKLVPGQQELLFPDGPLTEYVEEKEPSKITNILMTDARTVVNSNSFSVGRCYIFKKVCDIGTATNFKQEFLNFIHDQKTNLHVKISAFIHSLGSNGIEFQINVYTERKLEHGSPEWNYKERVNNFMDSYEDIHSGNNRQIDTDISLKEAVSKMPRVTKSSAKVVPKRKSGGDSLIENFSGKIFLRDSPG
eukprot:CAMPEP_0117072688 /NCGR_PEP_ID=MMETSP0472-20121206/51167_1 /TAXON_ID=693140 ORGANISM="Tiarina fusus, Strain LIS" /NCGR_SAMPLE_ID=MMETSP0472 /ASSEMBLY_ACC=CAM_ASM_000603 /LENGTH=238 /DNA_ID=CAMNT_0004796905 /DNA_START=59 /DNA_END=772 /DNA_ORIENTATION=+